MVKFTKELDEKILKYAHNAQFDIEMTKEFFDYAALAYKHSESELDKASNKYVDLLKN
jgi:hypothetical protein